MKKSRKTLVLVGIFAVALSVLLSGCPPSVEKEAAKNMISDAKRAGAKDNMDAQDLLKSAEEGMADAKSMENKFKYKDAQKAYRNAYRDAKESWKIAAIPGECSGNCPSGYKKCGQ